jgi:hypothetical protein
MAYERYQTDLFPEQIDKLCRKDAPLRVAFDDAIAKILETPQANDGQLKGPRSGTFKKYVQNKKYRVIFAFCEHCISVYEGKRCSRCSDEAPTTIVVFIEAFKRDDGYD